MTETQRQSNDGPLSAASEDMLLGAMRDQMLDVIRPVVGWQKLKEAQHHKINNAVEQAARQAIRDAAPIIAGRGFETISATVGDLNVKGENVVAKLTAERTRENILGLAEAGRCTLVLVNTEIYMGAKPAAVMKDQPGIFDQAETPDQKALREAIDKDAAEHEASVERARQFRSTDDGDEAPTIDNDTGASREADVAQAEAEGHAVDGETGELQPPAKAPRGHRGRRTSVEERTAKRLASVEA